MKTQLILSGLIFLLMGCNSTQQDDQVTDDMDEKSEIDSGSSVVNEPLEAIWKYDYNQQTNEFELKQLRAVARDGISGETLEQIINTSWPKVQIEFIRSSNDTAFVSIPDSKVLTQQMGTAGAKGFMISTTYSFTELEGIRYVSFDFQEGDHAIPGVYNRNSWDENVIQ